MTADNRYFAAEPRLQPWPKKNRHRRSWSRAAGVVGLVALLLFGVVLPWWTGVVALLW